MMRPFDIPSATILLCAGPLVFGCGRQRRIEPPLAMDALTISAPDDAGEAVDPRWWTAFAATELDQAIETALQGNFGVQAAYARLAAAEATVRRERGPLFPTLGAFVDSSIGTDDPFGGLQRVPVEFGLDTRYELDLWGRIRAQVRGQARQREATREDARTAVLSVSAAVATTWIDLAATREQLTLLDTQIEANEQMSAIVRSRVLNGVVRQADSLRQDRLVEQTRAARIARLEDLDVLEHRLAVLLGQPPDAALAVPLPQTLPEPPPLPATGLPSELLRRRPDVRAAEQRLYAADADVAVAVANLYPRFSIRAGVSNAPASPEALLTGWVASLGASLTAPLLEGGQRRAEVARVRALLDAEVADYGTTLLNALAEVEDALARNRRQAETVALLDRQVTLATQTAENLQLQYVGGLDVGYLDVLTAQTTAQQLKRQQIEARQRLLALRVDLYRALAGGFDPEPVSERSDG
jgi:NodT family efflux transporter outer membrane factor (OMF) lipoprotein